VTLPKPEVRERVRALAEGEWREPVDAVHLQEVSPQFDVPGRRKDGTVKGERLVRRVLWNILRGTVGGVTSLVLSVLGGGIANMFQRDGRVSGPENAQALGLVDAARPAKNPWLVYSESHIAVIDSGPTYHDAKEVAPLTMLWHAEKPDLPRIRAARQKIIWPDGSEFVYHVGMEEMQVQYQARRVRRALGEHLSD
jgi:hypothetical protein